MARFVVKLTYCSTKQNPLGFAENNTAAGDNENYICYGGARLSSVVQSLLAPQQTCGRGWCPTLYVCELHKDGIAKERKLGRRKRRRKESQTFTGRKWH